MCVARTRAHAAVVSVDATAAVAWVLDVNKINEIPPWVPYLYGRKIADVVRESRQVKGERKTQPSNPNMHEADDDASAPDTADEMMMDFVCNAERSEGDRPEFTTANTEVLYVDDIEQAKAKLTPVPGRPRLSAKVALGVVEATKPIF